MFAVLETIHCPCYVQICMGNSICSLRSLRSVVDGVAGWSQKSLRQKWWWSFHIHIFWLFLPGLFLLIFRALFIKRNESFVCELSCKYCFPVCHLTFDFAESISYGAESWLLCGSVYQFFIASGICIYCLEMPSLHWETFVSMFTFSILRVSLVNV